MSQFLSGLLPVIGAMGGEHSQRVRKMLIAAAEPRLISQDGAIELSAFALESASRRRSAGGSDPPGFADHRVASAGAGLRELIAHTAFLEDGRVGGSGGAIESSPKQLGIERHNGHKDPLLVEPEHIGRVEIIEISQVDPRLLVQPAAKYAEVEPGVGKTMEAPRILRPRVGSAREQPGDNVVTGCASECEKVLWFHRSRFGTAIEGFVAVNFAGLHARSTAGQCGRESAAAIASYSRADSSTSCAWGSVSDTASV